MGTDTGMGSSCRPVGALDGCFVGIGVGRGVVGGRVSPNLVGDNVVGAIDGTSVVGEKDGERVG